MTFIISIGTLRIISIVRGLKMLAMIIVFTETTIAISILTIIIREVSGIYPILAYGAGCSLGTFIGIRISDKILKNVFSTNIISKKYFKEIKKILKDNNYGVTSFYGSGKEGSLMILNVICNGKQLIKINELVYSKDSDAFLVTHKLESYKGRGPWMP